MISQHALKLQVAHIVADLLNVKSDAEFILAERLPDAIIKEQHVLVATGMSASTMRRRVKDGTFPAPVKLGLADDKTAASGWLVSEIAQWIADRRDERDASLKVAAA